MDIKYDKYVNVLHEILETAKKHNSEYDLTGALLFDDLHFIQFLEGPREDVMALFARIERDERHYQVTVIEMTTPPARIFGNWWMAGLLRSGETASLFEPYRRNGVFDPFVLTAGEILSLMVDLAAASPARQSAA
jgi:hypothetical protein